MREDPNGLVYAVKLSVRDSLALTSGFTHLSVLTLNSINNHQ